MNNFESISFLFFLRIYISCVLFLNYRKSNRYTRKNERHSFVPFPLLLFPPDMDLTESNNEITFLNNEITFF